MKVVPQTEVNLVRDLQAGTSTAFTTLYNAYSPALYGVLLRMVREEALAEDLLQDAFIKIWANIHTYKPEQGRLFTWLMSLTRNLALDELRSQQVQRRADAYLMLQAEELQNPIVSGGPLNETLVCRLAPKQREIVELVYYRNYTKQEVADELNLPLGTVKTRFRLALMQLKQLFQQDIHQYYLA